MKLQQEFSKSKDRITIRILNSEKLVQFNKIGKKKNVTIYEKIIIHIHGNKTPKLNYIQQGGGFVGMSSRSHQLYTIPWALNLKVPIFSIDYKLAPQDPYPAALNDVWQAYNWILQNIESVYNIRPKRIVLTGDSAGGNLCAALTCKLIQCNQRIPDGLLLTYPALVVSTEYFSPSLLKALDDTILPHRVLRGIVQAYLSTGREQSLKDMCISPLFTNDEILVKFPRVILLTGNQDSLHDDSIRFALRLLNLEKDVKVYIYENLPHGFLQFGYGLKEVKTCIKDAENGLNELLTL